MASRGGGANRTAGGPGPRPAGLRSGGGQAAAQIRCHCRSCRRGSPAENRHGGAPRGVPVAPGHGGRASHARRKREECACRRSIHPSFGVQWDCCCRDCRQGYGGLYTEASGKAGANRTDKPGAHKRAAGRKKTALFDIVSLRPWPTVRFARREFARSCPGRAKRDPGHDLTAQSRATASPCRTSARHGRSNASPRNRRRHRRESRTR